MKLSIVAITAMISLSASAQNINTIEEIVSLAKIYRGNHGLSELDDDSIFAKYDGTKFETVANFIEESIKRQNRIIEEEFLARPDSTTLKLFHTIIMVNYNMYETEPFDNVEVVQMYLQTDVSVYEQIKQYYSSLFISVINKNRPFDYSDRNWDLSKLGFRDEKEESVFFLVFMDKLGFQISSYHRARRGPNWDGIENYVKLLPNINGKNYYEFDSFYFEDFEMYIYKKDRYFKEYYLSKYYDILIAHLLMMEEKNYDRNETTQLLLTSIISKPQYYRYCNQMDVINEYLEVR